MNIVLDGGPHNGETQDNVPADCIRYHRGRSFYKFTEEVTSSGRRVFKYDQEALKDDNPERLK